MRGCFVGLLVHTVNTLKHFICPKEPHISGDVLSPLPCSLQHNLVNAAVTPDQLAAKGSLLSFETLLKSFLLNTFDQEVT